MTVESIKRCIQESGLATTGRTTSRRILVADDDVNILSLVSDVLATMGFEVATAKNGLEALSVFIDSAFDLVLTDLTMPLMDGWDLASSIKERSPSTPVILVTGSDRETVLENIESASIDSVLFKPFSVEDFQTTVNGVFAATQTRVTMDKNRLSHATVGFRVPQRGSRNGRS